MRTMNMSDEAVYRHDEEGVTTLVDLYAKGRLSPYVVALDARGEVGAVRARQPAGDMSDPPIEDLVIGIVDSSAYSVVDFGAGNFSSKFYNGDMYIVTPGTRSSIIVDALHQIRCSSFSTVLQGLAALDHNQATIEYAAIQTSYIRDTALRLCLERLWAAMASGVSNRVTQDELGLATLARSNELIGLRQRRAGGLAPWQTRRTCELMMDQLGEDLRLAEIAAEARLSPFHFCRSFKATMGLTPAQWLLHKRIERAVELLRATDLPLAEIALEVGYANQSAFTAAFSRLMGTSPRAFRRAVA